MSDDNDDRCGRLLKATLFSLLAKNYSAEANLLSISEYVHLLRVLANWTHPNMNGLFTANNLNRFLFL